MHAISLVVANHINLFANSFKQKQMPTLQEITVNSFSKDDSFLLKLLLKINLILVFPPLHDPNYFLSAQGDAFAESDSKRKGTKKVQTAREAVTEGLILAQYVQEAVGVFVILM